MPGRDRIVRAAATGLAVAFVSGCGGGDEGKPVATIQSVPTTQHKAPSETGSRAGQTEKRKPRKSRDATASLPGNISPLTENPSFQRALRKAARNAPASKRVKLVKILTRALLMRFGFTPAVTVGANGNTVRAALSAREACTATTGTEGRLVSSIREALPWLQSATIVVGQTGQRLSHYVRARCRPVVLPGGPGPVRVTKSGTHFGTTASFTVRSDRWTVEYINGGQYLQVIVLKSGAPSDAGVQVTRRGPGRQVLSGSGRVSLQVFGSGEWVVRVRDGA
jgi:hypothetical protein